MVEFDNNKNILSSLAKIFCTFILSHELVSVSFSMIKHTYSLRVGKLCWHDFECDK